MRPAGGLAETHGSGELSPQDLFATLSERDATSWEARLRHMTFRSSRPSDIARLPRRRPFSTGDFAEPVGRGSAMAHGIGAIT